MVGLAVETGREDWCLVIVLVSGPWFHEDESCCAARFVGRHATHMDPSLYRGLYKQERW